MIIKSLLDNDLYSFTVQYYYLQQFPRAMGIYEFTDRNDTKYPVGFAEALRKEVNKMSELRITEDEIRFISQKLYYLPKWYLEIFLKGYKFDPSEVRISQDKNGTLDIKIEGFLWKTVLWEVPLLALISELYHDMIGDKVDLWDVYAKAEHKFKRMFEGGLTFTDFGTRRRFSFDVHYQVVKAFNDSLQRYNRNGLGNIGNFIGTSNVYLAYLFDLTPTGTMSHQVISGIGALFGYKEANYLTMEKWEEVYDGSLGTYLYDTYGWEAFEENFSKKSASLYSGLRVDSGDNIDQLNKVLDKYKELGIDPRTKQLIFSNALDVDKALEIHRQVNGRIQDSYGIGTHFTCDLPLVKPANIVIKLINIKITEKKEWQKAIKLSSDKGKYTGDPDEVELALKTLKIKE